MQIRELEVRELHKVAGWLHRMNEQDHHYVAWMASDANEIFEQIWTLTQFQEPLAYVAWDGDEIIGFLGILPFFEQKLCRLLGPFALHQQELVIEKLWDKASLTVQLHFDIVKLACFEANEALVDFAEKHAFDLYNVERTLALHKSSYYPSDKQDGAIVEILRDDYTALDKLHPSASYYTTEEMLRLSEKDGNHLWGYAADGTIAGYTYFETIAEEQEGEICFVNVGREYRENGIGTALMEHALQYAFYALELDVVTISVRTNNKQAARLYEQFGFRDIHTIRAYQKATKPVTQTIH
ncbi:UNVERIFIED_CONTAM: GNAT family N-acetyltransferase [Halobacillus marinus]